VPDVEGVWFELVTNVRVLRLLRLGERLILCILFSFLFLWRLDYIDSTTILDDDTRLATRHPIIGRSVVNIGHSVLANRRRSPFDR
jgi:hypothetical protein